MNTSTASSIFNGSLQKRFCGLWLRCTAPDQLEAANVVWEDLSNHYREPHRHYHTVRHIAFCLRHMDPITADLVDPESLEMAIWFHDVIYDPRARDNEEESCRYFARMAAGSMRDRFIDRVNKLIMITEHQDVPQHRDLRYMCDIDLASFAVPWSEFLNDSINLRREQSHKSDRDFYDSKLKFLRGLLNRQKIFYTRVFYNHGETRARENIARFIGQVEAGDFPV